MICENCGKEIENNSEFCGYCGCPTSKMIRPMVDEGETAETPDNQNLKKKKTGQKKVVWIAVFVIAFILIAVAIIGFLIWRAAKENASFSFGELSVDEIYFIAGEEEAATFTVQAPDATGTIYLCDENGKSVEKMTDDGENDEIWRQTYLQTSSTSPCYAEPLLVTGTTASGGSGRGTELRLSTETGSLSGTAWYYGEEITEPAAGATVSLYQGKDLYMSVTTDENGEYSIPLLPAGAYDIVFSLEGYSDYYLDGTGVYRDQLTETADGYFLEKGTIIGMVVDGVTGELLPDTEVKLAIETDDSIYIQTISTDENL